MKPRARVRSTLSPFSLSLAAAAGVSAGHLTCPAASPNEIGYLEEFVLAEDREAVLAGLVPGTEDYFYFHALHYEHTGQSQKLDDLLEVWGESRPDSARRKGILNRRALLGYENDPESTIEYLVRELGLRFDHNKIVPEKERELPGALDQQLVSAEAFYRKATAGRDDLSEIGVAGLGWVLANAGDLTTAERRDLLSRLDRPDFPGVTALVVSDLKSENAPGFGAFPVHRQLLLEQLDELRLAVPELANQEAFVHTYLAKLRPGADTRLTRDPVARRAFLDRAWGFVEPLSASFNSLKAHLLYHRLLEARAAGGYDRDSFLAYLALPRPVPYVNPVYQRQNRVLWNHPVDFGGDYSGFTSLPPVHDERAVVRDHLLHFLADARTTAPFDQFLTSEFLDPLFAEAKITGGVGRPEDFTSRLGASAFAALRDRVDIELSPANPRVFEPGDAVALEVTVKNVPELLVKVYEINPLNVYLQTGVEVGTDISLDGLVANSSQTHRYAEGSFLRVPRTLEFPELAGRRGLWVIELVGNGISSRALVRKGTLTPLESVTAAGHLFTVADEAGVLRSDVTAFFGGKSFAAGEGGEIVIPFSQDPGEKQVVFSDGDGVAALGTFRHVAESYALNAGFHVERESLLAGDAAVVAVRPSVTVAGAPAPLGILQDVVLTVAFGDIDDNWSTKAFAGIEIPGDGLFEREVPVPPRAAQFEFTLSAQVDNISTGEPEKLSATFRRAINTIDQSLQDADLHLSRGAGGYLLNFLGKSGEPKPDRAVEIEFRRPGFATTVTTTLKSGEGGSVDLGELDGVSAVVASAGGGSRREFRLIDEATARPEAIHARLGQAVLVPAPGWLREPDRIHVSLLEVSDGMFVRNRFEHLGVEGGFVVLRDLPAGDYSLAIRGVSAGDDDSSVDVRVSSGTPVAGHLVSAARYLEVGDPAPLQVVGVAAEGGQLSITLANVSGDTRVHLAATQFVPPSDLHPFTNLLLPGIGLSRGTPGFLPSVYLSGRDIGDELRYIIERRTAPKFAGALVPRPGLLLNPWELRETETIEQDLREAEALRRLVDKEEAAAMPAAPAGEAMVVSENEPPTAGDPHNLDFLPGPGLVAYNLKPAADGTVRVALEDFGDRSQVHVLVTGAGQTIYQQVHVPGRPEPEMLDLRLATALDPEAHLVRRNATRVVQAGETLEIGDARTAELQAYATVGDLFMFYSGLDDSGKLEQFRFLTAWNTLDDATKRARYSEFACHELHVFLARKDPEFFASVVAPYLANKRDKTFVDLALLGADLTGFVSSWKYAQLNAFEQALLAQLLEVTRPATVSRFDDLLELEPDPGDVFFDAALAGVFLGGESGALRGVSLFSSASMDDGVDAFSDSDAPVLSRGFKMGRGATRAYGEQLRERRKSVALGVEVEPLAAVEAEGMVVDFGLAQLGDEQRDRMLRRAGAVLEQRLGEIALFRPAGRTKEYAENNYYHLPLDAQGAELVPPSRFWRDFAAHGGGPFVSARFPEASRHANEMLLALAVTDLPFGGEGIEPVVADGKLTLAPGSPVVAFYRELAPAEPDTDARPLVVSQSTVRSDDPNEILDGQRVEKRVGGSFQTGVVYTSRVVLSNTSAAPRQVTVTTQVPQGSVPVGGTRSTGSIPVVLDPYATRPIELHYYFPQAGEFGAFPPHVSEKGSLVAYAEPLAFTVSAEPAEADAGSWLFVSQHGTNDEVLDFLRDGNLFTADLSLAAWRLRDDPVFFVQVIAVLEDRQVFDQVLFSYALHHDRKGVMSEFLLHQAGFLDACGPALESPLVTIDPVLRRQYEHLDYEPLVNARVHKLGARRTIPNEGLYTQYHGLLDALACKRELRSDDRLALATYLLAQDRAAEAVEQFTGIDPAETGSRLQLAYLGSVLALYRGDSETARAIAAPFAEHPVERWRDRFSTVLAHLDEAAGGVPDGNRPGGRQAEQETLASSDPYLELQGGDGELKLVYRNASEVTVNYYEMDLEFLFSTGPFLDGDNERFSFIRPNRSDSMATVADATAMTIAIPDEYNAKNVLVEVRAGGARAAVPHFANQIDVTLSPSYGQLQVLHEDDRRPLPRAYIKVYAQTEAGTRFYKDGYTDLRGRFDYASLTRSGEEIQGVRRFALLVLSEDHGATVLEAAPPAQ